jgi:hypothetical protein
MPRNKKAKAQQKKRQPRRTRGSHYQMPLDLSHLALGEGTYTLVRTNDPHHMKALLTRIRRQTRVFLSQIETHENSKGDEPKLPASTSARRKPRHSSATPHASKAKEAVRNHSPGSESSTVAAPVIPIEAKPTETFDDQFAQSFQEEMSALQREYNNTEKLSYEQTAVYMNQVKEHIHHLQSMSFGEEHKETVNQHLCFLNEFFLHLCIDAINPVVSELDEDHYANYLLVIQEFINRFEEAERVMNTTSENVHKINICLNGFDDYLHQFADKNIKKRRFNQFLTGFFSLNNPSGLLHTPFRLCEFHYHFLQLSDFSLAFTLEQSKNYLKSCDQLVQSIDHLSSKINRNAPDFFPVHLASISMNMLRAQLHIVRSQPQDIASKLSGLSILGDLADICRDNFRHTDVSPVAVENRIDPDLPALVLNLMNRAIVEMDDDVLDVQSIESIQVYVLQYASKVDNTEGLIIFQSLISQIFLSRSGYLPAKIDTIFFATQFIYKACKIIDEKATAPGLNVILHEFKCFLFERLSQLTDLIIRGPRLHIRRLEDLLYLFVKASNFMDITLEQANLDVSFARLIHTQLNNLVRLLNPTMSARYDTTTTMHIMCSELIVLDHRPFVPTQHEVVTHHRYYAMFLTAFLLKLPRFNKDELLSLMPLVPARSAEELPIHLKTSAFTQAEADLKRAYTGHTNTNPEDLTPSLMLFQLRYRQQKSDVAQAPAEEKAAKSDTAEEKVPPPLPHPSAAPPPAETLVNRR